LNQSDEFFIGGEAPEIEAEETHAYIRKWLKENVSEKAVARGFSSQVNLEGNSMDRLESVFFFKLNWLMFIDMFFFSTFICFHGLETSQEVARRFGVQSSALWEVNAATGSNNFTVSVSQNEPLQEGPPQFISWFITHPILSNVCIYI